MIDKYAGELFADGSVNQHRRDRRIDAARNSAYNAARADRFFNVGYVFVYKVAGGPVALAAADFYKEIFHHSFAVYRMDDLGVELQADDSFVAACIGRYRASVGVADRFESFGKAYHLVAVAHPDLGGGNAVKNPAFFKHCLFFAVFALFGMLDASAEVLYNELCSVTNSENGNAYIVHVLIAVGRVGLINARGSAGKNNSL